MKTVEETLSKWRSYRSGPHFFQWGKSKGQIIEAAYFRWKFPTFVLEGETCTAEEEQPRFWTFTTDERLGESGKDYGEAWLPEVEPALLAISDLNPLDFTLAYSIFRDECVESLDLLLKEMEDQQHGRA